MYAYLRHYLLLVLSILACLPPTAAVAQEKSVLQDRPTVYLVPFGNISKEFVDQIAAHIEGTHRLIVAKEQRKAITKQMLDYLRRQVPAHELIGFMEPRYLKAARAGSAIYLGITNYDMYIAGVDWQFAFAARKPPGLAVVSTYQMDPVNLGKSDDPVETLGRAKKMVSKMIGHLYLNLPDSDDPKSLMYDKIRTLEDLDRISDKL